MMVVPRIAPAMLLALLVGTESARAEDSLFYRYEDGNGMTVIDDHVPPERAQYGYTVITKHGRVVEVVDRALTDEEREHADSRAVQQRLRQEEAAKQLEYDQNLLRRYSDVQDIEAARDRKVADVMVRINLLKSNIANYTEQISASQAEAARLEREGLSVPEKLLDNMASLRQEIGSTEEKVALRYAEKERIEARFEYDKQRFLELKPALARD